MAITEYYNNLRQLIHLNLQVPVYSESTFENQNVSLPCIVFSRDGTLGSQTMSGPSVMTETVTFSAKAKTIEKAEEMRAFIISILNGYDNEIQMVINSEVDEFEIDSGIYTRAISFDVVYGADIPYRNVVIGEGAASQIAIWQDRYILTGSNVMTITGSTVTFTGSVVVNGNLTVAGGFVAQNAVSASYALTSSFASSALTASYALNSIAGSSGTSGTSGANGSSGTSGNNGSSGTSGTNGTNGSSGTSGIGGSSGTSGQTGSSGTSGANGSSGTSGLNGSSGTSGLNGSSGTSGNSGSSGTSGVTGSSGTSGQTGSSGTSGADGSSGTSGMNGSSGTSGLNGSSGTSGLNGSSGTSGNSGSSGTSGLTGSSGTSGVGGSSGTSGIDGSSGTSGQNGSSGTSGQNGSSGTSGANGIDGSSGTSGQSGSSGTSGTNGTNGSSGTSGESGSSGTSGTSGANGSSGTSGLTQDLSGYVVTASGALNNLTASYAITASYAMNGGGAPSATASYLLGNASSSYIQFAQTQNATASIAGLTWDSDLGTLKIGLVGGNVELPIGQEEVALVYNAEATTLNKGEVVYASGSVTDRIAVKRANSNADATSARTLGIVAEAITAGGTGYVTTRGLLKDVNTSTYNAGDILYVSTSSGVLTNVKQYAPSHLVYAGIVTRVGSGNGSIFTLVQNGYELDELHNVRATSPVDGDLLVYSSSGLWENSKNNINITGSLQGTASYASRANSASYSDTVLHFTEITSLSSLYLGSANKIGSNVSNTILGDSGSNALTTGNSNVHVGASAGRRVTSGSQNILVGALTGGEITHQSQSVAIGHGALRFNNGTNGHGNTSLGYWTFRNLSNGRDNIAIGNSAFTASVSVSSSIVIGANSQINASNENNAIVIGNNIVNSGSNSIVIGNSQTTKAHIRGILHSSNIEASTITGSLFGTASYSTQALSASYAPSSPSVSASYAETASYLDTTSLVLNNLTVNNSITASNIEAPTGTDLYLFAEHTSQIAVRFTDSSSIWFNDADGTPEIWMTDANNSETAYIKNTGSYLEISPNNINAVKIGQTDVIFNVPITGSLEGTSSYALTASYALNGGGGGGTISSSFQLTNNQGFAFDSTSNVTFGQVTASNANITSVTASVILVDGYNQFGTSSADVHNFIGNVYITGSLNVSGGFNFSVGTASYALTALTASYALNASGGTTSSYFSSSALIIDTTPKAFITVATKYIATHSMDFKVSSFYDAELTGSLFVTASNLESGRTAIMRFFMSGSSTSSFAMNVPANWTYIGGVRPTALTGNRYSILSLTCFGSREQDVICGFSFSP